PRGRRGERRVDEIAELGLHGLIQAGRDPGAGDEARLPAAPLRRKREPLVEEGREPDDALRIQRVPEAGPDAPAREEPEDPLVIGGSTASPRPRRDGVEERAAGLDGPPRALTERPV